LMIVPTWLLIVPGLKNVVAYAEKKSPSETEVACRIDGSNDTLSSKPFTGLAGEQFTVILKLVPADTVWLAGAIRTIVGASARATITRDENNSMNTKTKVNDKVK